MFRRVHRISIRVCFWVTRKKPESMRVAILLVVERVLLLLLLLLVSFEYCMNEEEEGVHLWSEDDWMDMESQSKI